MYTELKRRGYNVKHVISIKRGLKDREIIGLANREGRIIVTLDEDFVHLSKFLKKIGSLVDILEKAFSIE